MSPRVLVVGDSLTLRKDLEEAFEAAGFAAILCEDAEAARRALAAGGFELVVLDASHTPQASATLVRELKEAPATAEIPLMVLYGEAEARDILQSLTTGADQFVTMPYDAGDVVACAGEILRGPPPGRAGSAATPAKVLVVDDSATFREEMREALEAAGYRVLLAGTGEEGLGIAARSRPDAAVIDGELPGIDGLTVVRRMRADAALRRTPTLLLTASETYRDEVQSLEAGADAYVLKGEDTAVILARLAALLRSTSEPAAFESESTFLGPKRILAVDDSMTYLEELGAHLRDDGYEVIPARSGEEALRLLAEGSFDCILLDLVMPGLSGNETCRRIKRDQGLRDIPLLMLTAHEDRETMIEGLNAGADDFIAKSGDFTVLKGRLRAQLRRKHHEDENRRIREELLRNEHAAREARAVRRSEELLRTVLETLPVGVWVTDATGRIFMENAAGRAIWGGSKQAALEGRAEHKGWWAETGVPIAPDDRAVARAVTKGATTIEEVIDIECLDGARKTILNSAVPIRDADDRILGAIIVNQDITGRRRAEQALRESEDRFRMLAETVPQIVWTANPDGWVDYYNRHWFKYTGMTMEQTQGWGWRPVLHPDDLGTCTDRWKRSLETGEDYEIEHRLKRACDGVCRWHLTRALPLRDACGRIVKWFGTCTDIDDAKRAEQALQEKNAELERARAQAEQESRFKSRFLASMSHELRTPLNAIIGFSELLEQELFGPLNPRQKDYVTNVLTSGRHLLDLVNDILDISKVEAGRMDLSREWVPLGAVVEAVRGVVNPLSHKRGIALEIDLPDDLPDVFIDPVRIKQVLYNLLSNAIKFTPPGGSARLSARLEKSHLTISVRDTGVGIRPEDMERLFREFERIESETSDKPEGTGLGLVLTRKLVELHGGAISAESSPGRGSTFTVTLPMPRALHAGAILPRGDSGPAESLVLMVEDDPGAAELIAGHLRAAGLSVAFAWSGEEAVRLARELRPAAITLDLMLPDTSGFALLGRLKSAPETAATPIVIISVVDEPRRGFILGATDYLLKPVSREVLLDCVARLGVPLQRVAGLKVLVVGNGDAEIQKVEEHLRIAGCAVRRAESLTSERVDGAAPVDLAVVDLSRDFVGRAESLERTLEGAAGRAIPILGLVSAGDSWPPALQSQFERLAREDALRPDRLVRAVRRALDRPRSGG